jgi:hypothetical protein
MPIGMDFQNKISSMEIVSDNILRLEEYAT